VTIIENELTLWVTGMTGEACRDRIRQALLAVAGVRRVVVDLSRNEVIVWGEADSGLVRAAVVAAGFGLSPYPVPEARGVG
jgi:copper chaperone CopZ